MLETIKNKHQNQSFTKLTVSKFLALLFLVFSFSFSSYAQDVDIAKGKSLFNANCAACHKLNKNLIGPALAGVSAKYEKEWLYTWIKNSNAMIKSGDERAVAMSFLKSPEFATKYGMNVSTEAYVNYLYKNVLGREADLSGLLYWSNQLNIGAETRYEVLLGFAESAENKALFTDMTGFG